MEQWFLIQIVKVKLELPFVSLHSPKPANATRKPKYIQCGYSVSCIQGNTNWVIKTLDEETMPYTGGHLFWGPKGLWAGNKSPGPLGKLIMLDFSFEHPRSGVTPLLEIK